VKFYVTGDSSLCQDLAKSRGTSASAEAFVTMTKSKITSAILGNDLEGMSGGIRRSLDLNKAQHGKHSVKHKRTERRKDRGRKKGGLVL
jgi:hypothetical protein